MVKKDGMILEQISFQERRRGRTPFYKFKFRLVLLNQYPGKNTLKAILIWQGLYVVINLKIWISIQCGVSSWFYSFFCCFLLL